MRQRVMIAMALACKPEAADRRRADHRARRDDPGADPRADARAAAASSACDHADHARPRRRRRTRRRRRGDVRGQGGRARRRCSGCSPRRGTPTRRACCARCRRSTSARAPAARPSTARCPSALAMPQGCRFHPRCALARDVCRDAEPPLVGDAPAARPPAGPGDGGLTSRCAKRRGRRLSDALLQVRDLAKHFPIAGGPLGVRAIGQVQAVDGVSFDLARGRDAGAGGRIRLRQVHDRAHAAAADRTDRRAASRSTASDLLRLGRRALRRLPARRADRVPGPVCLARPAHDASRTSSPSRSTSSAVSRPAQSGASG